MAQKTIEIDTAALAKPVGRPANVRIGGEVFEAKCPKDAVLVKIHREQQESLETVESVMSAMLGSEAGARVSEMIVDPDVDDVTLGTLNDLVDYLMRHPDGPQWEKALSESVKALGSGEAPRTVAVKRAPAKKTAAKRPAKR